MMKQPNALHKYVIALSGFLLAVGITAPHAQDLSDLDALLETPLSELVEIDVSLASGIEESIFDAPAAMVVVTAEEIQQRGYTNLAEIIVDLPGFDTVLANGIPYLYAYQRGYRHPSTQRTLLMINGHVDNHLWTHQAVFSRRFPLSSIKKVEVLYGPASAIYGPNAFLGIVNIVTYDGEEVRNRENASKITIHGSSYSSRGVDVAVRGKIDDVAYSLSGRVFRSDEPDLSGRFGFIDQRLYADQDTWGPLLDVEHRNRQFGTYFDPTDDNGVLASLRYRDLKLGYVRWVRKEGYGPHYVADRVQNNVFWNSSGTQIYLESERQVIDQLKSRSLLSFRKSRTWGGWPEALPDFNPGMDHLSFISYTQWNSISNSWLFKQQFEVSLQDVLFTGGFKFERKELTKAYDIPGYWGAFSSSVPSDAPGPHGFGAGIFHSTDDVYTTPPLHNPEMPPNNLAITEDVGGFVQGIFDANPFRFNAGIRYDHNSLYGRSVNPRVSAVYKFSSPKRAEAALRRGVPGAGADTGLGGLERTTVQSGPQTGKGTECRSHRHGPHGAVLPRCLTLLFSLRQRDQGGSGERGKPGHLGHRIQRQVHVSEFHLECAGHVRVLLLHVYRRHEQYPLQSRFRTVGRRGHEVGRHRTSQGQHRC